MRGLGLVVMVLTPLLLGACDSDSDSEKPDTPAPAQNQAASAPVPLRLAPEGLLGFPTTAPQPAPAPAAAAAAPTPPQAPVEDAPPSEAEVRGLYEDIMYTYAFDACGLPLIGQTARQDIERRIEVCANPPLRKDAFRTVYHRALEVAEQDPEKMRASAGRACPDKREFLRRVMSHAGQLQFDSSQSTDCRLLSPAPTGAPPANPAADAAAPPRPGKPF